MWTPAVNLVLWMSKADPLYLRSMFITELTEIPVRRQYAETQLRSAYRTISSFYWKTCCSLTSSLANKLLKLITLYIFWCCFALFLLLFLWPLILASIDTIGYELYCYFDSLCVFFLQVVSVMLSYSLCFAIHRPLVTSGTIGQPPNLTAPYSEYVWMHTWYHIQNTFMCVSVLIIWGKTV